MKGIFVHITSLMVLVLSVLSLPLALSASEADSLYTIHGKWGSLLYDFDYRMYFDNRESRIPLYHSQTILGMRLSPEVGWHYSDAKVGSHSLVGGLSYIQPFGTGWRDARVVPTIYYRYRIKGFYTALGIMPWRTLRTRLPRYLMSDSLESVNPNLAGALFGYESKNGYVELFCDWRGMQRVDIREAFRIIIAGQWQWRWLQLGGLAQINHLAGYAPPSPPVGVCDDITVHPYAGFDFSRSTVFDTLALKTGFLAGYQRMRITGEVHWSYGFLAEFSMKWRYVGLDNTFYVGRPLMSLYEKCGASLNQGDPLYAYPLYNRTDISVYVVDLPMARVALQWNLHYVPGRPLAHQQMVVANFSVGALMDYLARHH